MSSDVGDWPLSLLILLFLFLLNGLSAASMRALDHADRNKLRDILEDEPANRRVQTVLKLMKKPSVYHYADLIVSYLLFLAAMLTFNGMLSAGLGMRRCLLANAIFLLCYIALADILPKKMAAQASERYAIGLAGIQKFFCLISWPLVRIAVLLANFILILMRKETEVDDTYFSEDKVRSMLEKGQETGDIKEEGRKMIDSIFAFDDLLAYEIMTPRTDVFMIDLSDPREEYLDQLMELRYSRIPVCDGDADNIVGLLHIKDYLLKASKGCEEEVDLRAILREPYFVPETKNIDSLFVELQKSKQHIAILIDEYGGFSGLVSVEDIIEQIVGDIDDEFDEDDRIIEKLDENVYLVDGNVYLDDLDEETGVSLESENSETIGGFIIELMGEIPKENVHYQPIEYEEYRFRIMQVKDRRIEKIKITIAERAEEDGKEER